jgi:protein TonB
MKFLSNQEQNLNEIIFAKKNKSYGAYAIRASYNNSVITALGIVSSVILLFAGILYVLNMNKEVIVKTWIDLPSIPVIKIFEVTLPNEKPKAVEKLKSNPPAGQKNNSLQGRTVTDSVPDNEKITMNLNVTAPGTNTTEITEPFTGTATSTGTSTETFTGNTSKEPFLIVEEMPEFEGGDLALLKFVAKNIVYPSKARDLGVEGVVRVSFVVDETGQVGDVKIVQGIGFGCDEESIRVVSKIPKYKKAGKQGGRAVRVRYTIPINYKLGK